MSLLDLAAEEVPEEAEGEVHSVEVLHGFRTGTLLPHRRGRPLVAVRLGHMKAVLEVVVMIVKDRLPHIEGHGMMHELMHEMTIARASITKLTDQDVGATAKYLILQHNTQVNHLLPRAS